MGEPQLSEMLLASLGTSKSSIGVQQLSGRTGSEAPLEEESSTADKDAAAEYFFSISSLIADSSVPLFDNETDYCVSEIVF
jgi:hypothetical protein